MKCRYCNDPSGWFSFQHGRCKEANEAGSSVMRDLTTTFALGRTPPDYEEKFSRVASASHNLGRQAELRFAGVQKAFDMYLNSGADDQLTEDNLYSASAMLVPNQRPLLPIKRIDMMGRLRDLSLGRETLNRDSDVQPLLDPRKGEFPIWTFRDVRYLEEKTHRHYEGRSAGVSVRVMKGVSVRVGQSKGRVVEQASLMHVDTGLLAITNKRLHFMGSRKAFKLFYDKLALIEPYSDGLKIIRDSPSAKPQVFMFEDGWFANEVFRRIG